MKRIAFLFLLLSFVGCVFKAEKKTASKSVTPVETQNTGFRIEIPSSFNILANQENRELLVIVPQQVVSYRVDNEAVATICDSALGTSLCFHSAGAVNVTATNSNGESVVKHIEVFGALNFTVDKSATVTFFNDLNFINLNSQGGFGITTFSISEIGDNIGSIVNNQYIPPTRDRLVEYLGERTSAQIFIKAQDERGNSAIQEISVFPSALVDLTQQVPIVCDNRNILSNSYFIAVDGGLPLQYIEVPEGANINVSKLSSQDEQNSITIFKITANGDCEQAQDLTVVLKDSNQNFLELNVRTMPNLQTSLNKDRFKDNVHSAIGFITEGENTNRNVSIEDNSDQSISLNMTGARPPYRVFLSSPKNSTEELPITSQTLKLNVADGNIPISSNEFELYQRSNQIDCAAISYNENNDQSRAKFLGVFDESTQISMNDLNSSQGFYRLVIVDCNGVYNDYDFYKSTGEFVDISNNTLDAGSPFSTLYATFIKSLNMSIELVSDNDQIRQNLNGENVSLFSRLSSENPATCNGHNCIAFIPYKIFEGVDSTEPVNINVSVTDGADVTFSFEKFIYPGFKFHYLDRGTNQYIPFSGVVSQEYVQEMDYQEGNPRFQSIRDTLYNERLATSTSPYDEEQNRHEFLSNPRDIKISGGIGIPKLLTSLNYSEQLQRHLSEGLGLSKYDLNTGQRSSPWYQSCLADENNSLSFGYDRYTAYTLENGEKNFIVTTNRRDFLQGQAQKDIYFDSPYSGEYRYKSNGIYQNVWLDYESYQKYNETPSYLEYLGLVDKRIMDCISDQNDKCIFWTHNLDFISPDSNLGYPTSSGELVNSSDMPWLSTLQARRFLNNHKIAKVRRDMRLGAAIDKRSDQANPGISYDANIISKSGNFILYQQTIGENSKVCIYNREGFRLPPDPQGWSLSEDLRSLCIGGVTITGSLVFPFSWGIFYYQSSINSPISKMYMTLSGNLINSITNQIDIISVSKSNDENAIYKLLGVRNNLVFIETNFTPDDNDSFTCSDSPENTNLLVVKNVNTSQTFTSQLLNYVPDNELQSKTPLLAQDIYKSVLQKNEACDFGNMSKGILKINSNDLNADFLELSQMLPENLTSSEVSNYFINDYSLLNINGDEKLYIAGVRKKQVSGTETYAQSFGSKRTQRITLNYDAPFLIKVDQINLQNSNYKLYERPEFGYLCHKNTEIKDVGLFLADARSSYPNGDIIKTVNLLFSVKGAYHQTPFRKYLYVYSRSFHIGYLGLDQHMNKELFHRVISSSYETELLKDSFGISDTDPITVVEKGREGVWSPEEERDVQVNYKKYTNIKLIDFRER